MPARRNTVRTQSLQLILKNPLLFAEVCARLVYIQFLLWLFPLKKIAQRTNTRRTRPRDLEIVYRFASIFERHLLRSPQCLRTSLLLFWLGGIGTKFYIGANRRNGFKAHAWVQWKGRIFSGTESYSEFELLFALEKAG